MTITALSGTGQSGASWPAQRSGKAIDTAAETLGTQGGPPPGGPAGPPPGGHGGPPPAVGAAMKSLAETLGVDEDDLTSELQSGTSLTDVAAAYGMDADTLRTTLTAALTEADSSLTADQAAGLADKMIAGPNRDQDNPVSRLTFDSQLSGSGTAGGGVVTQAALQALYSQYSAV
ncbi:hypothetical protein ACIBSW_28325 [Actinoplanes sp. NPDC049668]|uniref:hypothetical protein n=1 Tax=unclassified Actinoplanes TaxID=2626549 RepID=UPI0033B8AE7E